MCGAESGDGTPSTHTAVHPRNRDRRRSARPRTAGTPATRKVALAYTADSHWRNRAEFVQGRDEIVAFLTRKWAANSTTG